MRIEAEEGEQPREVCLGCKRVRGNPSVAHLNEAVGVALRLDRLREAGARFDYPAALAPFEWACLEALTLARRNEQEATERERERQAEFAARKAELERVRKGRR